MTEAKKPEIPHTEINKESIVLRDDDNNELLLGFDESFENSVEYFLEDNDSDLFYIGIKNLNSEDDVVGIGLTVDQLRNLINTAQRLIRRLETGE